MPHIHPMATKRDYYEVLGVEKTADSDTIKKAYRKLAMQFHPDRNPGNPEAEEKFKEAAAAYEVLSDAQKRAAYDRFGHQAFGQGGFGGQQGFQNAEDIFAQFGDIFGDLFGMGGQPGGRGQRRSNGPRRGADLRYIAEMDLKDVITGLEKELEFDTEDACGECDGNGAEKGSKPATCPQCNGSGQVVSRQGFFTMASTCPRCRGDGQIIEKPCKTCKGKGRTPSHRKIAVKIPPGVDNGTRLRISNEGEGGFKGGPAGDLYVEIRLREHDLFEREGEDLFAELSVPYVQLLLGGPLEVETLTGETEIEIPRSCQPGELLKISGQGLPSLKGSRRGHIFYRVKPVFPEKVSAKEEEHLQEIAQIYGIKTKPKKKGIFN
ncbi:MAG: molecular chaperone DnaJ [Bdellovibrionota bacterium]